MLSFIEKNFFYRQHPETALRHYPIIGLLRKRGWGNCKILEVGSGSYGITPYLKREVVGVDTDFSEPYYPLLKQVKSSAKKLPFDDKEFDLVILSDVLEHLPSSIRKSSINDCIRVAKKGVIVSGPFGEDAAKQDRELSEYSLRKLGRMHPYFEDHLKLGLPEERDVSKWVEGNSRVKDIIKVGEYLNISIRRWLMHFFITDSKLIYYFYLKGMMVIVPLLRLMNKKPCYRTLLLIELK